MLRTHWRGGGGGGRIEAVRGKRSRRCRRKSGYEARLRKRTVDRRGIGKKRENVLGIKTKIKKEERWSNSLSENPVRKRKNHEEVEGEKKTPDWLLRPLNLAKEKRTPRPGSLKYERNLKGRGRCWRFFLKRTARTGIWPESCLSTEQLRIVNLVLIGSLSEMDDEKRGKTTISMRTAQSKQPGHPFQPFFY